jgi:NAD(P)H-hydrate repair Nnr-like enzyme with NAD(P)H-hydrate epimerase domain
MDKIHDIQDIRIDGDILIITVDGSMYNINICKQSTRLTSATAEQRTNFIISPSGYGIHWPDIDEDLSIDGLLGIKHLPPMRKEQQQIKPTIVIKENISKIIAEDKPIYK